MIFKGLITAAPKINLKLKNKETAMDKKDLENLSGILPSVPGIHGKQRLFNSAVMITLIMIDNEYHFLFEKRAKGIRQEGEICFPGGKYELKNDSSCLDTALRETSEELGIDKNNIKVYGRMNTIVAAMGATIDPFIGVIENAKLNEIKIQESEVEKIFLLPVSWFVENKPEIHHVILEMKSYEIDDKGNKKVLLPAKKLGLPKRYHDNWGGFKHRVLVYDTPKEIIWGLTAEMVNEFVSMLEKIKTRETV